MKEYRLGAVEAKFADIIWNNEPLQTSELIKLCSAELGWKRTTTYTVLKRLSERNIFCNNNGTVTSLISRDDFYSAQSKEFVDITFNGSLPAFLAAFTSSKGLTEKEVDEIKRIIDSAKEE